MPRTELGDFVLPTNRQDRTRGDFLTRTEACDQLGHASYRSCGSGMVRLNGRRHSWQDQFAPVLKGNCWHTGAEVGYDRAAGVLMNGPAPYPSRISARYFTLPARTERGGGLPARPRALPAVNPPAGQLFCASGRHSALYRRLSHYCGTVPLSRQSMLASPVGRSTAVRFPRGFTGVPGPVVGGAQGPPAQELDPLLRRAGRRSGSVPTVGA